MVKIKPVLLAELPDWPRHAADCAKRGYRLLTMVATDERAWRGTFVLRYFFVPEATAQIEEWQLDVPEAQPEFQSFTRWFPAANWYEREVYDLFGLKPQGHVDLRPLVLHADYQEREGIFPLRKDFPATKKLPSVKRTLSKFALLNGEFEVPVGPIHAGIIEPGHFRFRMRGEDVLQLDATLFYTHRGIEKMAEGLTFSEGLALVEQTCGVCSVSHALSFAQALEAAAGMTIPAWAKWIRTLAGELERLYNHVGDVGNICAGIGFSFGVMQAGRLKERLQQLNARWCKHRYLRGIVAVGGVHMDVTNATNELIFQEVNEVLNELSEVVTVILNHEITCDRFRQTGILPEETARSLAVVGPTARASGIELDARKLFPYAAYVEVDFLVPTYVTGDVMARFEERVTESYESGRIIRQVLSALKADSTDRVLSRPLPPILPYHYGVGISESPRGENVHFVMVGNNGRIERLRIRSASYANWPAVPGTAPGNIIADFPLINKSFELCYACCDR